MRNKVLDIDKLAVIFATLNKIMWGLLVALIVIGIIIILSLALGQFSYKKFPKIAYVIWGITILFLISVIYSVNTRYTRLGDQNIGQYIGTYKIDKLNSIYDSVNWSEYNDLLLIVKEDHTFYFSKVSPFFDDSIGKWQLMSDGDISWTEIAIGNQNLSQAEVEPDKWLFTGSNLANGNYKNRIVFLRH